MDLTPVTLEGEHVRLETLSPDHEQALLSAANDEELWRWATTPPPTTAAAMRAYLETAWNWQQQGTALPFATLARAENRVVGTTRFANIDHANRRAEIGWTFVARPWQRTAINTEAKYLMLRHAFETLGCIRVEFKADSLNEQSRRAILRLGAKEEGIFRNHMIAYTGRLRHSAYYSIIDSEWPEVKAGLEAKLRHAPDHAR